MRYRPGALALSLLVSLVGCFQPPDTTTNVPSCPGCKSATSSARGSGSSRTSSRTSGSSSGGTVSTAGTGSSTSSTSSSGSGGTTTAGSSSGSSGGPDGGAGCPAPLLPLDTRIYDISSSTALAGAVINSIGQNGIPIAGSSTTSRADGTFTLCVPNGVEVTPEIQAAGYPTTYVENFDLTQPLTQFAGTNGIPMLSTSLLTAFASLLPVGSVAGQAAVAVVVASVSCTPPCNKNGQGWSISLALPDGGLLPDGGTIPADLYYADSTGFPTPGLTQTSPEGVALFFNVDTALSSVVALEATNPDAGQCPIDAAAAMLTGRLYVATGALTIAVLPTP